MLFSVCNLFKLLVFVAVDVAWVVLLVCERVVCVGIVFCGLVHVAPIFACTGIVLTASQVRLSSSCVNHLDENSD